MKRSTVFHLLAACYYPLVLAYDLNFNTRVLAYRSYGGRFKFLTFINMLLQTSYFCLALVTDVFSKSEKSSSKAANERGALERFRDFMFASLVFPLATFITAIFWTLYFIDRELIYPKELDDLVPPQSNLIQHLYISFWIVLECLLVQHHYPSTWKALGAMTLFGACYTSSVFWVAHVGGFWVYRVLAVLSTPLRILFFTFNFGMTFVFYFVGRWLTNYRFAKKEKKV